MREMHHIGILFVVRFQAWPLARKLQYKFMHHSGSLIFIHFWACTVHRPTVTSLTFLIKTRYINKSTVIITITIVVVAFSALTFSWRQE